MIIKRSFIVYFSVIIFLLSFAFCSTLFCAEEIISALELINNGQDLTRPRTRFDLRYQYDYFSHQASQNIITFRLDKPVAISSQWQIATRIDLPLVIGNLQAADNPSGKRQFTTGDLLTEGYLVYSPNAQLAMGIGSQFIWPTAYDDQGGDGKYQFLPFVGVRYFLPQISLGSFALPSVQYVTDYAGNKNLPHIRMIKFAPTLHIIFPQRYFLEFYSSETMLYDFWASAWSIPANFMIGKMITENIVVSIEFIIPMFKTNNYKQSNLFVETRVGIFF